MLNNVIEFLGGFWAWILIIFFGALLIQVVLVMIGLEKDFKNVIKIGLYAVGVFLTITLVGTLIDMAFGNMTAEALAGHLGIDTPTTEMTDILNLFIKVIPWLGLISIIAIIGNLIGCAVGYCRDLGIAKRVILAWLIIYLGARAIGGIYSSFSSNVTTDNILQNLQIDTTN